MFHCFMDICYFSQNPGVFSTKCVQLIGKCFRDLETLSIGGHEVDLSALTLVGESYIRDGQKITRIEQLQVSASYHQLKM